MENLAFHSLLRWKIITLPILTSSPIHSSLQGWENVLFELGSERARKDWKKPIRSRVYSPVTTRMKKKTPCYCEVTFSNNYNATTKRCRKKRAGDTPPTCNATKCCETLLQEEVCCLWQHFVREVAACDTASVPALQLAWTCRSVIWPPYPS